MITFKAVTKRYSAGTSKAAPALDDVSFSIDAGEIFGYIGPNGAGKTTSIKIIVGLIRDFDGSVTIDGEPTGAGHRSTHRLVGYMPQSSGFQEWRTVRHTLETFGRLSGLDPATLAGRVDSILERLALTEYAKTRLVHLSGGTLQRLRLAQAVLHEPKVLVLDEPMTGLDPESRYRFKQIIRELAVPDRLIFFSSHILSDVEDLATRVGVLSGGRIRKIGTPEELRKSYGLGEIVEIATADGGTPAPFDPASFVGGPIVSAETHRAGVYRFHIDPADGIDDSMRRLLSLCLERGLPVRRVVHMEPSLEEVYLDLTGNASAGASDTTEERA